MYMIVRGTFELSIRRENGVPSKHDRATDLELDQTATTRPTDLPHGEFHTTLFNVKRLGGARSLAAGERKQRLPRFAEFALFNPWVHKASLLSTGYGEVARRKQPAGRLSGAAGAAEEGLWAECGFRGKGTDSGCVQMRPDRSGCVRIGWYASGRVGILNSGQI